VINPSRVHRAKAVIYAIGLVESRVQIAKSGAVITAWTSDLPKDAEVGERVNVQANFSITMDGYVCRTVRRPRSTKAVSRE
jgi:hypothetical protein